MANQDLLICTTLTGETPEEMLASMTLGKEEGANLARLCFDSMHSIDDVGKVIQQRILPVIVHFRCPFVLSCFFSFSFCFCSYFLKWEPQGGPMCKSSYSCLSLKNYTVKLSRTSDFVRLCMTQKFELQE